MNPALPVDQRVNDLIGRMTLEEKVSQMRDHAPSIPRRDVPKYDWWNEGLHGVAFAGYATNFPHVIGTASWLAAVAVRHVTEIGVNAVSISTRIRCCEHTFSIWANPFSNIEGNALRHAFQ
jgi:beta-glucosidase